MIDGIKLAQKVKPGSLPSTWDGHWAAGSSDVIIGGKVSKRAPRRARGVHLNTAMWIDPYLKDTSLQDPLGGSAVFYDSKVRLVKV